MKLILFQDSPYIKIINGAIKADRELMTEASNYYDCKVYAPISSFLSLQDNRIIHLFEVLRSNSVKIDLKKASLFLLSKYENMDIEFYAYFHKDNFKSSLKKQLDNYRADHIFISVHNVHRAILEPLYESISNRPFSLLVHASFLLPFGPHSYCPSEAHQKIFARAKNIFVVSHYLQKYIEDYSGLNSKVINFPILNPEQIHKIAPPYFIKDKHEKKFITLVNPCLVKGIDIFLDLAKEFSRESFASVPGWGTTQNDIKRMKQIKNITLLNWFTDIDNLFKQTKILLVPSICYEAFGLIVVEAMSRGIPVIASNIGGLPEAKLGLDYLIPVSPIKTYHNFPNIATLPKQNIELWIHALKSLIDDTEFYQFLSRKSYITCKDYLLKTQVKARQLLIDLV